MLIKKPYDIKSSEITDRKVYLNRRLFMRGAALLGTTAATGLLYRRLNSPTAEKPVGEKLTNITQTPYPDKLQRGFAVNEKLTSIEDITSYNNFYEFSTNKGSVASESKGFVTKPWTVSVEGLVNKPKTFDLDELLKLPQEDRVYRLRCVEGWSMVIPWVGFPLSVLLKRVDPTGSAKYVEFSTLVDPSQFPGQKKGLFNFGGLDWPYTEGLRLDEALHPLTLLTVGMY